MRIAAIAILLLLLASCAKQSATQEKVNHYRLSGTIVRLDEKSLVAIIKHETITDAKGGIWMDAMTMEFPLKDAKAFALLRTGARIRATVHQSESDYDYWIDEIQLDHSGLAK